MYVPREVELAAHPKSGFPPNLPNFARSALPCQRFVLATIMAPQLDAAKHILIEVLLEEGFETKLLASVASCSVRAIQRIRLKQFEMPIQGPKRAGRRRRITAAMEKVTT